MFLHVCRGFFAVPPVSGAAGRQTEKSLTFIYKIILDKFAFAVYN